MNGAEIIQIGGPPVDDPERTVALELVMESCATREEMNANVRATVKRGYTRVNEYLDSFTGTVSICGAGPSIARSWPQLEGDVLAINSAIRFLTDQGVPPRWAMIWDASPLCAQFVVPHPAITYLVGARCHPSVFERLKGSRTIVWHAAGDHNIGELLQELEINEPLVLGGSAGVTRALYLAFALGYREFHLHGADSSFSQEGATHVRGSLVPEKSMHVRFGRSGPWFRTTPEWAAQVEELKLIYGHFSRFGCRFRACGDGLLPYAVQALERAAAVQQRAALQPLEEGVAA